MTFAPLINALLAAALWLCLGLGASAQRLTVFAAASLQGPLDAIAQTWPGDVTISYAGSGTIARQISLGAPADVVVLASPDWMTWLEERGALHSAPEPIISNALVLIGPAGAARLEAPSEASLHTLLGTGRLAMGQHMAVPAGVYAAEWLQSIEAWDTIRPRLAETENVRAALALVARGEVPLGLVYASDAAAEPSVSVLYTVPPHSHAPILYPAAAVTPAGVGFVEHLRAHQQRFVDAGFKALP